MSQITLSAVKCTPSENGGFVVSWKNLVQTALGLMFPAKGQSMSFCTKSATPIEVGTQVSIDLNAWDVTEGNEFIGDDGLAHRAKWLRPKA